MNHVKLFDKHIEMGYFVGVLILFIISPLLSLIYILRGMFQNIAGSYFMFSIFMALLAYMLAPVGDLASYGFLYYKYQHLVWDQFWADLNEDFIMQTIIWLFSQSKIPFGFVRFFQTIIAFNILNCIFMYKIKHSDTSYTNKEIIFRYFCYVLLFPFILMVGGVRFGFAVVIMLYGFHLYIDRGKSVFGLMLLLLSVCIHFSLLYFSVFSFLILQMKLNRVLICIILVLAFIMSYPIQSYLETYFLANEMQGAAYLGDGVWGRQEGHLLGLNTIVYHWGQRLFLLPLIFALFKRYNDRNAWLRLGLAFIFLFACTYTAFALAQRLTVCFMTYSIFLLLSMEEKNNKFSLKYMKLFMAGSILICCFDLWTHREQLILSEYWRLVQPSIITLSQEYDKIWLFKYANERLI